MREPKNANDFDKEILLWTKYWNEVFKEEPPLEANIVKALFFSESSFRLNVKAQRITKNNYARGPLQVSDQTRKILADEKGELKDHYLTIAAEQIKKVEVGLAAAIRWLFHKKKLASSYLGKSATWTEAIGEYKGYLKKSPPLEKHEGMRIFLKTLTELKKSQEL